MSKTKKIILSGLLLGLLIILSRFVSFKSQILVISASFFPIMISAILLGPKYSCIIAGLGDLVGALLWPFGTYFVGFTIFQAVVGLVYGLFLYKADGEFYEGKSLIIRLILSSVVVLGIIELPCMSLMLHLLYGNAFIAVLSGRLVSKLVMLPIQVVAIYMYTKSLPLHTKYLFDKD